MIVELRKAGFNNKGAELMLIAILERMRRQYPNAIFTTTATEADGPKPFSKVVGCGMYPKFSHDLFGCEVGDWLRIVPKRYRERYGLCLDSEVDVVIDAAGYSYGDPFSPRRIMELADAAARWKRKGKKIILMPQAFGPFSRKETREAMRRIVLHADLIMPREPKSAEYLFELAGEAPNIRQFPDFTLLVEGRVPPEFEPTVHRVCLVPNAQMVAKTWGGEGDQYLFFMQRSLRHLVESGAHPFLLIHESARDGELARRIAAEHSGVPILHVESAPAIKGVIGACHATIGSRYHGLVSALSQGVPSLATGWSHKYAELFSEYGCSENILDLDLNEAELKARIDRLMDSEAHAAQRQKLLAEASRVRERVEAMWQEIFHVIDGTE